MNRYMLETFDEFENFLKDLPKFIKERRNDIMEGNFWIMENNGELIIDHKDKHSAYNHPMKQVTGCYFGKEKYMFSWNDRPYMFADGRIATVATFLGEGSGTFYHEIPTDQIKW